MLIDAHCHLHEFKDQEIWSFTKDIIIAAVSDDFKSSKRTIKLAEAQPGKILAFIGVHPWELGKVSFTEVKEVAELAADERVAGIGEVGLDKKFVKNTFSKQLEVFTLFVKLARDHDLPMNVHAPEAWREVLDILRKHDIERAIIHWYTGPLELLEEIEDLGFFITVNPAISIQKKLRRVVEVAPLEVILTESDGPYKYRGMGLSPKLIPKVIEEIASLKGFPPKKVASTISDNFKRFMKHSMRASL